MNSIIADPVFPVPTRLAVDNVECSRIPGKTG